MPKRTSDKPKSRFKKHISDNFWLHASDYPYYDNLHQYSKNKIHCSCPMCSPKTKNKGKRARKNYNPTHNYKPSDLRKKIDMDLQEEEINE